MKRYKLVKSNPVAKFYYKGSHSHPVRRTILVIESNDNVIVGYEVREGSVTRDTADAPVKSYNKNKIARLNQLRSPKKSSKSTLKRMRLFDYVFTGP
jgi:hypothetical protein